MAYADLSTEQKSQLDGWDRESRAFMGEFQQMLNRAEALRNAYYATDGISSLFLVGGAWADGEAVPNTSGLAGSGSHTKVDLVNMETQFDGLIANASSYTTGFDTVALQQQRVIAAGPANTV